MAKYRNKLDSVHGHCARVTRCDQGLNLKVSKMNYRLGNPDPNYPICSEIGQNVSRSGQSFSSIIDLDGQQPQIQQSPPPIFYNRTAKVLAPGLFKVLIKIRLRLVLPQSLNPGPEMQPLQHHAQQVEQQVVLHMPRQALHLFATLNNCPHSA